MKRLSLAAALVAVALGAPAATAASVAEIKFGDCHVVCCVDDACLCVRQWVGPYWVDVCLL
jgi:hypothetical protein